MYKYCCRICLANGEESKLCSLYMKIQIESYAEMVEFCTGIEVNFELKVSTLNFSLPINFTC